MGFGWGNAATTGRSGGGSGPQPRAVEDTNRGRTVFSLVQQFVRLMTFGWYAITFGADDGMTDFRNSQLRTKSPVAWPI